MKKMRILLSALLIICLAFSVTACNGGSGNSGGSGGTDRDIELFLEDATGIWYRFGNLHDENLNIYADGTWDYYGPDDELGWGLLAQGTIAKSEFDKDVIRYENEIHNIMYHCSPIRDGMLHFNGFGFIREEDSVSGLEQFDGDWYLDGETDKDYYQFESGEWKFYEAQGMGHTSTSDTSGFLVWHGGLNALMAYGYRITEDSMAFAIFTIEGEEELNTGGDTYLRLEGAGYDDFGGGGDDYGGNPSDDITIATGVFYYQNGNTGSGSWYFYSDGTVDLDAPYQDTVEGVYEISDNILTVTLDNSDNSVFVFIVYNDTVTDDDGYTYEAQVIEDEWGNKYWN